MDAVRTFIESENRNHQVVVWSKSYCGYCSSTVRLFQGLPGVELVVHQLDQRPDGTAIQNVLGQLTKQRTVPNVFINNRHVGGNSDVQAAHRSGQLQKLLSQK